jgi:hypothetical protein
VAQFRDQRGRLFTVFAHPDPEYAWEWRREPVRSAVEGPHPDLGVSSACWIECRWEEIFTAQVRTLAIALSVKSRVLDGDGELWPAEDVDPAQVRL